MTESWVRANFTVSKTAGNEWSVHCPLHDDSNPSASVNIQKKVFNCHRCGGHTLAEVAQLCGWQLPPGAYQRHAKAREVCRYDYCDDSGMLLYQIVRMEKPDGGKTFLGYNAQTGEWKLDGVARVPYRLPELLAAIAERKHVFVCEGEKDCDTLRKLGFVATTNANGARSTKQWQGWGKWFPRGTRVFVCPDADVDGKRHAQAVSGVLTGWGCAVHVLDFGFAVTENHGKDVTDWVNAGHTEYDLINMIGDCGEIQPEKEVSDDRRIRDYGHAEQLLEMFSGRFRYATHRRRWMEYQAGVWDAVSDEWVAKRAADYLRSVYHEGTQRAIMMVDKPLLAYYQAMVRDACTFARINGALNFLKGWEGVHTVFEDWDRDGWLLNLKNGTLCLKDGAFRDHDPDDMITHMAPVDYDPSVEGGLWLAHVERFLPHPDVRREVQRNLGISLAGVQLSEIFPIWYGTGGNGKTTTIETLKVIMGSYWKKAVPDLLIASKYDKHPAEIADLVGARQVFSVEIDREKKLAESRVKELTGGDTLKARHLYGDFFEFSKTWTLFLVVNHKPIIGGVDSGIWRRVRLIPWSYRIDPKDAIAQDDVISMLVSEGSAIINWALDGLRDYLDDPSWISDEVRAATQEYQHEQDRFGGFFDDCCECGKNKRVSNFDLYQAYTGYCDKNGETPFKQKTFSKAMKERDFEQVRTSGGDRVWVGIRLKVATDAGPEGPEDLPF